MLDFAFPIWNLVACIWQNIYISLINDHCIGKIFSWPSSHLCIDRGESSARLLRLHIWHLLLITSLTWQFKEECIWFTRLDFLCAYVLSGEGPKKQALNLNAFFPNSFYFNYSTYRVVFWTVPHDFQNQNERKVATKHGFSKFNVKQILIGWGSFFYFGTENRKEQ